MEHQQPHLQVNRNLPKFKAQIQHVVVVVAAVVAVVVAASAVVVAAAVVASVAVAAATAVVLVVVGSVHIVLFYFVKRSLQEAKNVF